MAITIEASGVLVSDSDSQTSYTTGTDGGSNLAVSGTDRLLLVALTGMTPGSSDTPGASSVTFNGQALTLYSTVLANSREWFEWWYLKNPNTTAGAGLTVNSFNTANQRSCVAFGIALSGVDQTTTFGNTDGQGNGTGGTTFTASLTTTAANSLVEMGVGTYNTNTSTPFTAADGGTIQCSNETGTGGATDSGLGVSYESVASAGAMTTTINWANSNRANMRAVEILEAAGGGLTLDIPAGSYTYTGNSPDLLRSLVLNVPAGSYNYTGSAPGLLVSRILDVPVASYTYTGNAPDFVRGLVLDVPAGSYTFTGFAPDMAISGGLDVPLGTYTFTGFAPQMLRSLVLDIPAGSYTHTGNAPDFALTHLLDIPAGSYTYTGNALDFVQSLILDIPAGSYTYTGNAPVMAIGGVSGVRSATPEGSHTGGSFIRTSRAGRISGTFRSGKIGR